MANELDVFKVGHLVAAADLSAKQYTFVKVDSTGKVAMCTASDFPIGILQNKPTAGQACEIMVAGVSKIVLSGTIAPGVRIKSNATGLAVAGATATFSPGVLFTGGDVNEIGSALINCGAHFIET